MLDSNDILKRPNSLRPSKLKVCLYGNARSFTFLLNFIQNVYALPGWAHVILQLRRRPRPNLNIGFVGVVLMSSDEPRFSMEIFAFFSSAITTNLSSSEPPRQIRINPTKSSRVPHFLHSEADDFSVRIGFGDRPKLWTLAINMLNNMSMSYSNVWQCSGHSVRHRVLSRL